MVDAKTLSELSDVAQQLNAESDNLNTCIQSLNDQLQTLNLGLEYWLEKPYTIEDSGRRRDSNEVPPRDYQEFTILGYCKLEAEWQLAIREEIVDYEWDRDNREERQVSECSYTPLLKASRDVRLAAVERFDMLLVRLREAAESKLKVLQRAKQLAKTK